MFSVYFLFKHIINLKALLSRPISGGGLSPGRAHRTIARPATKQTHNFTNRPLILQTLEEHCPSQPLECPQSRTNAEKNEQKENSRQKFQRNGPAQKAKLAHGEGGQMNGENKTSHEQGQGGANDKVDNKKEEGELYGD